MYSMLAVKPLRVTFIIIMIDLEQQGINDVHVSLVSRPACGIYSAVGPATPNSICGPLSFKSL